MSKSVGPELEDQADEPQELQYSGHCRQRKPYRGGSDRPATYINGEQHQQHFDDFLE